MNRMRESNGYGGSSRNYLTLTSLASYIHLCNIGQITELFWYSDLQHEKLRLHCMTLEWKEPGT